MSEDIHVHVHVGTGDSAELLAKITELGEQMSALTDAVDQLTARVEVDAAEWRRLLAEALATEVSDAAKIAELTARADALTAENAAFVADTADAIARMGGVDPDPNFPPVAPPTEPPVDPNA